MSRRALERVFCTKNQHQRSDDTCQKRESRDGCRNNRTKTENAEDELQRVAVIQSNGES